MGDGEKSAAARGDYEVGLREDNLNIEFTQHDGDEMYHTLYGGLSDDWIPDKPDSLGSDHGTPKENLFQCRCWLIDTREEQNRDTLGWGGEFVQSACHAGTMQVNKKRLAIAAAWIIGAVGSVYPRRVTDHFH